MSYLCVCLSLNSSSIASSVFMSGITFYLALQIIYPYLPSRKLKKVKYFIPASLGSTLSLILLLLASMFATT